MAEDAGEPRRCGFVAVLGSPNAGKSTLVNRLTGAKVTIVSAKVQTTRVRVLGITVLGPAQLVFIDTPGIFDPHRRLERAMVDAAWRGARDADMIVLVVDAARGIDPDTRRIVDGLTAQDRQAILALNKIDLIKREKLLVLAQELNETGRFTDTFMISATTGDGVDDLRDHLAAAVPEGPWMFPEDQVSDMPLRLLAAEITREQLFHRLHQELPYALTVETEQWTERKDGSVRIDQTIHVERASQKGIVLGRGGRTVKAVGEAARRELAELIGQPVHLFLNVRVSDRWSESREHYAEWGLEFDPGAGSGGGTAR